MLVRRKLVTSAMSRWSASVLLRSISAGLSYFLYYREKGVSRRTKVDGNLAVAHATASTISSALANHRPSPLSHQRTSPQEMVAAFLDYVSSVQKLALSTHDRYRAALDRFLVFCKDGGIAVVDTVDETTVENFVRWLRGQTRTRNGSACWRSQGCQGDRQGCDV